MLATSKLKKLPDNSIKLQADDTGRLTSAAEVVLQNLLISTDCDFKLISRITGLDNLKIVETYLKYQQHIDKIINTSNNTEKDNKLIEECLGLLEQHINQIVEYQKHSPSQMLRDKDLTNVLRILDRLCAIRNTKISEFDKLTNSLVLITTKVKTLEAVESGKIQLATDSNYNFDTIANKLDSLVAKTNKAVEYCSTRPLIVVEGEDIRRYPTLEACKAGENIGCSTVYRFANTGVPYKNILIYDEDEYAKLHKSEMNNETK